MFNITNIHKVIRAHKQLSISTLQTVSRRYYYMYVAAKVIFNRGQKRRLSQTKTFRV